MKDSNITYNGKDIQWLVSRDTLAIIHFGPPEMFEIRKGPTYLKGTTGRSYQNDWPAYTIPKRWLYIYSTLRRYYERYYEVHPNPDCSGVGFCYICGERRRALLDKHPILQRAVNLNISHSI